MNKYIEMHGQQNIGKKKKRKKILSIPTKQITQMFIRSSYFLATMKVSSFWRWCCIIGLMLLVAEVLKCHAEVQAKPT